MKILKFYADWCKPCKSLNPTIDQLSKDFNVPVEHINIENSQELVDQYQIRGVPTVVIVDGEKNTYIVGNRPYDEYKKVLSNDTKNQPE